MERATVMRLIALALLTAAVPGAARGQEMRGLRGQDHRNQPPSNMSNPGSGAPNAEMQAGQPLPAGPASTLPSTVPTGAAAAPADVSPATPPPAVQAPAQRAQVSFNNGQLSVTASNSSLNQILRDVSRATGIKITGGIVDERVFGNYGPDTAQNVLAALLDGTSTNMLLVGGSTDLSPELVLSPRTGGVTPPNPNARQYDANNDDAPPQPGPEMIPQPQPGAQSQPAPVQPAPQAIAPAGERDTNTVPAPATTYSPASGDAGQQQQSPNGVKTPQQIFDELMKLRQQQQQTQH